MPQPFIWGAYNGATETYIEFATGAELADFFRSRKTVVYAHNGGRFDWHYLREEMNSDENVMIISGRLSRFKVGECEFRDSMNIFQQTALKDFGNKLEIDYAKMEPEARQDPNNRAEISKYLRVDCIDLWNQLARYFEKYGRGLTQAGTAMRVWSKMSGVKPPQQTKEQFKRYKPFYYGGRVECFKTGVQTKSFKVLDINSAYPKAMLERHPFATSGIVSDCLPESEIEIARSLIRVKCKSAGAFPYRIPSGELIFPNDNEFRVFSVTGWEFLAALEYDAITGIEIQEVHTFPLSIDFAEYVTRFYTERKLAKAAQDKAADIFCKLFMNSLYGKFGSNPGGAHIEDEEDMPSEGYHEYLIATDDTIAQWTVEGYKDFKAWGKRRLMMRPLPEVKHRYFNVATAASITGFVRAQLFRASRQCQGLIYCDTDSIAAEDTSRLTVGSELGQWKIELECQSFAVAGKKNYTFEAQNKDMLKYNGYESRQSGTGHWKIASKGARLTPREMIRVARNEVLPCDVCKKEHVGVCYRPESPTYSITRNEPRFIDRKIRMTENNRQALPV